MKIIFFPGWPRMEPLLEPFLKQLREDFVVEVYNENFKRKDETIFISYSAGIIPLSKIEKDNDKVIIISPAGLANRGFFSHCFSFLRELFNTPKKIGFRIFYQSTKTFLRNPFRSWKEIKEIRRFVFRAKEGHFIMLGKEDLFMPFKDFVRGKTIKVSGNHFQIIISPKKITQKIRAII